MTRACNDSVLAIKRPRIVRAAQTLWRLAIDHAYRDMMWLHLRRPRGTFQPFNETKPNRYPKIFAFVQQTLGAENAVRILSFGCSTGEEVFSLRSYFPHASIKGIDINAGNIAVCRRRIAKTPDAAISFEVAASTAAEPAGAYDAIFCMAVLRHGDLALPGVTRCDHLIPFAEFAQAIADLNRCLKPGGLLIVRHSNFRLCDAPAGAAFETVLRVEFPAKAKPTPLFGPDDTLLPDMNYPDTVFRKTL